MRDYEPREPLVLTNPNKAWVVEQVDRLRKEWEEWLAVAEALPDSPEYDPQTCTEVIKDGEANIRKHDIQREKTMTFLASNFEGYGFLFESWPDHPYEDNTARRFKVIPSWIHRMETLAACIEYARVPDGYWKSRGKQLVEAVAGKAPEKAVEIAAAYLKGTAGI